VLSREPLPAADGGSARRSRPRAAPATTEVLRLRVAAGVEVGERAALPERTRRALAVAERTGAPLLPALDGAMAAEDDAARAGRAVEVASAQARVVAAGLLVAPAVLVPALGRLAGADLLGFYTAPTGLVVLAVGLGLLGLGAATIARLIRQVGRARDRRGRSGPGAPVAGMVAAVAVWQLAGVALAPLAGLLAHRLMAARTAPPPAPPGLDEAVDLTATALGGGLGAPEALRVVADELTALARPLHRLAFDLELGLALPAAGAPGPGRLSRNPRVSGGADDPLGRLRTVLTAADALGAPAVPTLRRLGTDLRAEDLARVLAAAERLPAQLTFPTALCLLPATLLLVGAPIVHAGLAGIGT
jgi:Flp pilus assembly protein TadB